MHADTQQVLLEAPFQEVFDFVADAENLPLWAIHCAKSVHRREAAWRVATAGREVGLRIAADKARGTVDFVISPAPAVEVKAYCRVMPVDPDRSILTFTQVQFPGISEEAFAAQVKALVEELEILASLMAAKGAALEGPSGRSAA
jgi:uncharacterized membrane protein